jgi:hypothetical protein
LGAFFVVFLSLWIMLTITPRRGPIEASTGPAAGFGLIRRNPSAAAMRRYFRGGGGI